MGGNILPISFDSRFVGRGLAIIELVIEHDSEQKY